MINPPHRSDVVVNAEGRTEQTMRAWMDQVTELLNRLEMLEGDGDPETVVTANKKQLYFNNTGSAGTLVYVKSTDGGKTGWVAIG